jgi:REP element-mobilizing transposase RayT
MARVTPKRQETAHITVRCNNQRFYFNLPENFNDIVSWINCLPCFYHVKIHHLLLMSNHLHMMVTPTENNFGRAMSYLLTNLSKFLNYQNNRINHNFGSRYYSTIIDSKTNLSNVIRYIYHNPLRAGICNNLWDYPYSSLNQYLGFSNSGLMISGDSYSQSLFQKGMIGREIWIESISEKMTERDVQIMRESLKRKNFKYSLKQTRSMMREQTTLI